MADEQTQRWRYWVSTCQHQPGPEGESLQAHLDRIAAGDWELVSANAVWVMEVYTPRGAMSSESQGWLRHVFYWRKRIDARSETGES